MLRKLLFILVISTCTIQAQTLVTPVNGNTQVLTTLELNRNLNSAPTFTFNRSLMQPVLANPGFIRRTTIVIEQQPILNVPLVPALNRTNQNKNCKSKKPKVERPFVPTYIHLNLNKQ